MHRITLKDLAKETGFSAPTVSRALNNHPRISKETKDKVLKAADRMSYQPSLIAKGFREKKSYLIGLIIYDLQNPFHAAITKSILDEAQYEDYQILIQSTYDQPDGVEEAIRNMKKAGVEGLIITACRLNEVSLEKLINDNFPVVQVMRKLKKSYGIQIVPDGEYGINLLVNHLLRTGRKKIAMIGGPKNLSTSVARYEGYYQALKENDVQIDEKLIFTGNAFDYETGYKLCKTILRKPVKPDAIVCADDHIAFGAMQVIDEAKIDIPQDIAIVGFDDTEMSAHPRIQLTSVKYDLEALSRPAVKSILNQIKGEENSHRLIKIMPQLVVRKTCGYHK